ncbi:MAG TPA: transglycosylase domain-containing protein [Solirubrobacteraceae bacterium]|nr:transglycosylase domain-containing protein [Solirubrobacteraceae bacterium]
MSRRERQRRRRKNRGSPLGRVFGMTAIVIVAALAIGALGAAGWVLNKVHAAPNLPKHPTIHPSSPSEVFAADGTSLGWTRSTGVHIELSLKQIPRPVRQATIAIEDRRFYQHGALDYEGIVRALLKDALHGSTALQGASTLTQQDVDNAWLPRSLDKDRLARNLTYKIAQAKLAEQLESKHSKNWILTQYLNVVPYGTLGGQTAYGIAAAAQTFFDKPLHKLSLDQVALLAGMPQAPTSYNPFKYPKLAKARRNQVLQALVTADDITQKRANKLMRRPLGVKASERYLRQSSPFVFQFIVHQAGHDLCPHMRNPTNCPALQHGVKIYTTLNLADQAAATKAIEDNRSLIDSQGLPVAAGAGVASVQASNGHILALGTSEPWTQSQLNYSYQASRQTGSAFKVFALMTMIHDYDGNPNDTYYTSRPLPLGWTPLAPDWSVHTDDYQYHGSINITHATAISDNTVFAQLVVDLGVDKMNQIARAMGITSPLSDNPSEVLGALTYGTTPLQMADAYATIADGGVHHDPTIIDKIVFPNGRTLNFGDKPGTRVFPYNQAYAGIQVLKGVLNDPGATGQGLSWGCPAAGKTGTAEDLANAWFVGFTPQISTGVWVGDPNGNVGMADGFGGALAGPIWKDYMETVSHGYCGDWAAPPVPFTGTAFRGPHSSGGGSTGSTGVTTVPTTGATTTVPTTTPTTTPQTTPAAPPTNTGGGGGGGGGNHHGGAAGGVGLTGNGTG